MFISRRHFLAGIAAGAVSAAANPQAPGARAPATSKNARIVVVGGGVAGVTVSVALRKLLPTAELLLIERDRHFVFAPGSWAYLFGSAAFSELSRGYEVLAARQVHMMRATVTALEPRRHRVRIGSREVAYSHLVVATGVQTADEEIAGLGSRPNGNANVFDSPSLPDVRRRLGAYQGGNILVSVPPPPVKCPPAPYEYALLLAEYIRERRLKGRVILLDANSQPEPHPLREGFEEALRKRRDIIEYVPQAVVSAVDTKSRKVLTTDNEGFAYELLSLIPPNRPGSLITDHELAAADDVYADVDPLTFRSSRFENVFVVGDAARAPYGKSAIAASLSATLCAEEIARSIAGSGERALRRTVDVACYPYVDSRRAMRMAVRYSVATDGGALHVETRSAVERAGEVYAAEREAWAQNLLRQMFGA